MRLTQNDLFVCTKNDVVSLRFTHQLLLTDNDSRVGWQRANVANCDVLQDSISCLSIY